MVATLGFFDGVHLGHRHLIKQVVSEAKRIGQESAVITFPIHPRKVLDKDYQPPLLCGLDEKVTQLATTEIDNCIMLDFTRDISQLSAKDFIQQILKDKIGIKTLFVGYDHRFGKNREEEFEDYCKYGAEVGINMIKATAFQFGKETVSSSQIRYLLAQGDISLANTFLSYNYTITGKIVEGYQVGRRIGFPTANIKIWERYKVIPTDGVYAVRVHIENSIHEGMLYIGNRPTLHDDYQTSVEVNIFDFDEDLYNKTLTVEFVSFVRPDIKFNGVEPLIAQINKDKIKVREKLKGYDTKREKDS
ncbi:MAG: bifunctional riboflavin kinase/FAD synthetase [Dysgonamonadaceae bacterium]|nr:bifunctional riboflavin kinase/FAD synthetase [Dysgonamonadaceae bacterium]MDD4729397.1 bifunctional riboflavin kinase/FAD synthetase [Dysgonamonadaceae bacterium]